MTRPKRSKNLNAALLAEGNFLEAFDLNANEMREMFGDIYDEGIAQAREQFIDEVIHILQAQYKKR